MQFLLEALASLGIQLAILRSERLVLVFLLWPLVALLSILPFYWLAPGKYDLAATSVCVLLVLEILTLAFWLYASIKNRAAAPAQRQ